MVINEARPAKIAAAVVAVAEADAAVAAEVAVTEAEIDGNRPKVRLGGSENGDQTEDLDLVVYTPADLLLHLQRSAEFRSLWFLAADGGSSCSTKFPLDISTC
jgi:hypothetical protein